MGKADADIRGCLTGVYCNLHDLHCIFENGLDASAWMWIVLLVRKEAKVRQMIIDRKRRTFCSFFRSVNREQWSTLKLFSYKQRSNNWPPI